MAVMGERLRWLGHALWKKDELLPNTVLFGWPSRAKQKAGHPRLVWEDFMKKYGDSWGIWGGFIYIYI